jgi:hypothetical protein
LSERNKLPWKGEPVELVELLYALHEAGCFGKTFLKNLFSIAEEVFACDMKNHYRLFWGMKERIKGERATFLSKLMRALTAKMEELNEKPSRK